MKTNILFLSAFFFSAQLHAQVGVGTTTPQTTFQVVGDPGATTVADGIMAPRLTGNELKAKDAVYGTDEIGALVYITSAVSGPSTKTANVSSIGYYYFDGDLWQKVTTDDNVKNIYTADGTIAVNRNVTLTNKLSFNQNAIVIDGAANTVGVGISGNHPSAILDVTSTEKGFLPPRMTKVHMDAISAPAEGLMVYCTDCNPKAHYYFDGTEWVSQGNANTPDATFGASTLSCVGGALAGSYQQGLAMAATNTKTVTVNVATMGKYSITTNTVNGVKFSNAGTLFTVGSGVNIVLKAEGTPLSVGTFTYTVTLAGQTCPFTVTYTSPASFNCANLTQTDLSPSNLYLTNGTSYTQTITVPYTAGNGAAYGVTTVTSQGLTLTRVAGTYLAGGGSVTYNLTGTYSGTTGSNFVTFTTADGFCPIQVNANSVRIIANAGVPLQMDNLAVQISTGGGRAQVLKSVRAAASYVGGGYYVASNAMANTPSLSISTSTSSWTPAMSGASFGTESDEQVTYLRNTANDRWYKITTLIGAGYNNNMLHIERMDVSNPGISTGANVNATSVSLDNLKARISGSNPRSLELGAVAGSFGSTGLGGFSMMGTTNSTQAGINPSLSSSSFTLVKSDNLTTDGHVQQAYITDNTNTYLVTLVVGSFYNNNLIHIEKLTATTPLSDAGFRNANTNFTFDGIRTRMASGTSPNTDRSMQISVSSNFTALTNNYYTNGTSGMGNISKSLSLTSTPAYLHGWNMTLHASLQFCNLRNVSNNDYYRVIMMVGNAYSNNFFYIKKY